MFNIDPFSVALGFGACAVLSVKFPQVGVLINAQAARFIAWSAGVIAGFRSKKK